MFTKDMIDNIQDQIMEPMHEGPLMRIVQSIAQQMLGDAYGDNAFTDARVRVIYRALSDRMEKGITEGMEFLNETYK